MSLNNGFINSTIICNEKKEVDLDALNLLAAEKLFPFCRCTYKNEKKHHHFIYDTKDLVSLTRLQAGLSSEDVIDILSSVSDLLKMLAENNLIIDNVKNANEYIFRADDGYKFIYIPLIRKEHISVKEYLIKLLSVIHHKDVRINQFVKELRKKNENEQACEFLAKFVSSYKNRYDFSEDETSLLSDEGETTLLENEGVPPLPDVDRGNSEKADSILSDEGETTVLAETDNSADYDIMDDDYADPTEFFSDESGEYETTVLTSRPVVQMQSVSRDIESKYCLCLIRNRNGEKISVDVTPFTIGKDSSNMDFVLNNDSVSRHHATIIYENGDYFIMDNNSTNGTTIEGIKIQPGEKGEIGNGYIISLGNESFQAHIERG